MSIQQHAEEILLESDFEPAPEPTEEDFSKVSAHLVQVQKWKHFSQGSRILDNRFLFVKKFQSQKTSAYWVNLLFVDPQPQRERRINWRWGLAALIFLALTVSLWVVESSFHISEKLSYINSAIVILGTMVMMCILAIIYTAKNNVMFITRTGRVPVASFLYNNPSKGIFREYIKSIKMCTEAVHAKHANKSTYSLANELAEHRRLKDEKIITDRDYEQAKNRILSRH